MIQSYTYGIALGDKEFSVMEAELRLLIPKAQQFFHPLRGVRIEAAGKDLRITLRVAGLTRWHVQREAQRIMTSFARRAKIPVSAVSFVQMATEYGRGYRKYGEGRTEMTRRPRAERMADGRPWDHIAWEEDADGESSGG